MWNQLHQSSVALFTITLGCGVDGQRNVKSRRGLFPQARRPLDERNAVGEDVIEIERSQIALRSRKPVEVHVVDSGIPSIHWVGIGEQIRGRRDALIFRSRAAPDEAAREASLPRAQVPIEEYDVAPRGVHRE